MTSTNNNQSTVETVVFEGTKEVEDGKTVVVLRFVEEPGWMDLPIGLIPEGTEEGDRLEITVCRQ